MNMATRILEPGQMDPPLGEIPFLFRPARNLFARRAERFRHLSIGHPLGEYLSFLAFLADAQQRALNQFPPLPPPDPNEQVRCRERGIPLLDSRSWPRNPAWRSGLHMILQMVRDAALPPAANETITGLMQAGEAVLEKTAGRILSGDLAYVSPQELPFVAAALQVYWVHMAASFGENAFGRLKQGGLCPVCGSHPVVGIVRSGGRLQGLRYLSCSLCASEWHMVRIKCSNCETTEGINFYTLEGSNGEVKAESCRNCNVYLKLLYLAKNPNMEAMADDLATLALDMLMDKEGKERGGPNLFFHPGQSH